MFQINTAHLGRITKSIFSQIVGHVTDHYYNIIYKNPMVLGQSLWAMLERIYKKVHFEKDYFKNSFIFYAIRKVNV